MAEGRMIYAVSLGCAKNTVDSERVLGLLASSGFIITSSLADADFFLLNTCGFLKAAEEEAEQTLHEAIRVKRRRPRLRLIVMGCWPARRQETLARRFPEVSAWFGVYHGEELLKYLEQITDHRPRTADLEEKSHHIYFSSSEMPAADVPRFRLTPRHYAYLRIADGCSHRCTFCTIPAIRGPYHSKPIAQLLEEARELVSDGARELILVAQDTTRFGLDRNESLFQLLTSLERLEPLKWLRLLYAHPYHLNEELIPLMKNGKLLPYLDLPLQHTHPDILKLMGRSDTLSRVLPMLDRFREAVPRLVLRTTVIVGFPGETPQHFAHLLDFFARHSFARLGIFAYSAEEGTPASSLPDRVPDREISSRWRSLTKLQHAQVLKFEWGRTGHEEELVIEESKKTGRSYRHRGRSYAEAPEIDPAISFFSSRQYFPGEWIRLSLPAPIPDGEKN